MSQRQEKGDVAMWAVEWAALSARIAGLIEAIGLYRIPVTDQPTGSSNMSGYLLDNADDIVKQLERFCTNHAKALPEAAHVRLKHLFDQYKPLKEGRPGDSNKLPQARAAVTLLASFRAEFTYLISDTEAIAQSRVARAFAHLQRSIVADPGIRATWNKAFKKTKTGEPACEKLGATHLLLHGIWAFKANADHGQTDLVLGNRLDLVLGTQLIVDDGVRAAADALVLTEWKVVRGQTPLEIKRNLKKKAQEAYVQAKRYSEDILAGFELATRRYLVLVSSNWLPCMPEKHLDGNVVYEYVSVAVCPELPSKQSRRQRTINRS